MLKYLELKNVGPAPRMRMDLAPRLNLITGDNGLGKSFLLDIAWWALTRRWPAEINHNLSSGLMARPHNILDGTISFRFTAQSTMEIYTSKYNPLDQSWTGRPGRPSNPGLVLYAQVDGSFALWDPARNYWRRTGDVDVQERQPAYVFSPREVWDGLKIENSVVCEGLIRDWAVWQREQGDDYATLCKVLAALSEDTTVPLQPGGLARVSLDDVRDMPTIRMPYGADVPIVHASAGIRRVAALAYLLSWSWREHRLASTLIGQARASQVIFLIDEIEAHLHPRWQRSIVGSLLEVVKQLAPDAQVQLITATHSPLVMASAEPLFDENLDAWFDIDLVEGNVELEKMDWVRHGDTTHWLTSDAFDMDSAGSKAREQILEQAAAALESDSFDSEAARRIDAQLRTVLSDIDPFWKRWRFVGEKKGWLQ